VSASQPALAGAVAPGPGGGARGLRQWLLLAPLMAGTFLGTLNNNIVNVPLKQVLSYFRVPLSHGAFVVIAFNLTFAVLMPLAGWLGDRVGCRRLFCWAVGTVALGGVGAMTAPSLPALIAFRVVQGAGTAAILPIVMAIIADVYTDGRRGRALGIWAAVNGFGQAVGPPLGGFIVSGWSWRLVFAPTVPLAVLAVAGALVLVPRGVTRRQPVDLRGALSLTCGAAFLIGAVSAVPVSGLTSPTVLALAAAGLGSLAAFLLGIRRRAAPFIPPRLLLEPSYLRSSLAVFAQMCCLGAMLLGVPLYLTRRLGLDAGRAGVLVLALPAVMTVLAPAAGRCAERWGPRRVLRAGLVTLAVAQAFALARFGAGARAWQLEPVLVLAGIGVAFVQTPAATGATRSPAGRAGAGLGLFNLVRFAGSAIGAAWVSITLTGAQRYGLLFLGCLIMAVLGLAGTYVGRNPAALARHACGMPAGQVSRRGARVSEARKLRRRPLCCRSEAVISTKISAPDSRVGKVLMGTVAGG
jgi:EmrB/QacA subfamily drug resistance transporter